MKKYIIMFFAICLLLTGCTQQTNITKEVISKDDSQEVSIAKTIKNKFLEYKNKNVFIINTLAINDDVIENTMIRKNGTEVYIESHSPKIVIYRDGKNYMFDTNSSEYYSLSDLNPEHEDSDIVNPFIDEYVKVLDWTIKNKDAFSLNIEEAIENNTIFKVYTFTGKDNEWIKKQYDETYELFEFWKDSEMIFEIQYIFDKDDNLIQYLWTIGDKSNKNVMMTEGKLGRDIDVAYSEIGYNLDNILGDIEE